MEYHAVRRPLVNAFSVGRPSSSLFLTQYIVRLSLFLSIISASCRVQRGVVDRHSPGHPARPRYRRFLQIIYVQTIVSGCSNTPRAVRRVDGDAVRGRHSGDGSHPAIASPPSTAVYLARHAADLNSPADARLQDRGRPCRTSVRRSRSATGTLACSYADLCRSRI